MRIYQSITECIGNTPIVQLSRTEEREHLAGHLFAKLEYYNPSGSVKDRIAAAMLTEAEMQGLLKPDTVIIEPTSGNTGIGLAMFAASKGYRLLIVMPENMSQERKKLLRAYGAELCLTPKEEGMRGAIAKAHEIAGKHKNCFIPAQFVNPANPACHRKTTGVEIWEDMGGQIDVFVAGVGTGGTISGVGEYLRCKKPEIEIIAVEPENSAVLSGCPAGMHQIQGIGAGFVPDTLNTEIYDRIIRVTDEKAGCMTRQLARTEGLLVGISSGAAAFAAAELAKKPEYQNKNILLLFPDSGERYISTGIFDETI
ncbi:MAG: cysteine synthase A [Ruminococcus sp.]|nr:cysteine synthase A [Ruminococcus sp.]